MAVSVVSPESWCSLCPNVPMLRRMGSMTTMEAINAALVKHKVASVVTPSIINSYDVTNARGNVEHQVTVGCNILLIDSESGESIDLYGIGTGQDAGDKAVMKAETAAIKYAYLLSCKLQVLCC